MINQKARITIDEAFRWFYLFAICFAVAYLSLHVWANIRSNGCRTCRTCGRNNKRRSYGIV